MTEFDSYLEYLTEKGASERYEEYVPTSEYWEIEHGLPSDDPVVVLRQRLIHELDVIQKAGFAQYFLIVADLMRFCRESEIPVGPGRGSVCGSAVAYATYITDVDPIRFGIPFERFLHLERVAQPDIDLDICQARRGEAIQYLRDQYGEEAVAQIITFGTMQAKGVVRDVVRILKPENDHRANVALGDDLSSLIPEGSGADQIKLEDFIASEEGEVFLNKIQPLEVPYDGRQISVLDTCMRLEGLRRHGSVHAAGVVIGDRPLIDLVPLYRKNQSADVQIQFDYRDAEDIGLLKLDVLGLRTVTVLGEAERFVRRHRPGFRIKDVPLDDAPTFELLQAGDTVGVFQLEGDGITSACTGVKPDRFDDIIALIALYRPGPMEQLGTYIKRKHGEEEVAYDHPDLQPILERTYGLIVYQEQVMGIARKLAGYTPGEADLFRKAIGKKLPELIREEINKFQERAVTNGYDPELVDRIGSQIMYFGRYGFNLGHATGYAFITYWTAYLKANYPTEFFAASLNSHIGDLDKIAILTKDASRRDVRVMEPDINESLRGFTITGPRRIRFGLEAVKSVGSSVVQDILEERDSTEKNEYSRKRVTRVKDDGTEYKASIQVSKRIPNKPRQFESLYDFCERLTHVPVNVKESLVAAGAFTSSIQDRSRLYSATRDLNQAAKKGKPFHLEDWDEPGPSELEMLRMEKDVMGFYVSGHPLDLYRLEIERHGAVIDGSLGDLRGKCVVAGIVTKIRTHMSKRGQMAWVTLETGIRDLPDITLFNDVWSEASLEKDDIVIVHGTKKYHAKFGWNIVGEAVQKIDRARPNASTLLIGIPDTDLDDLVEVESMLGDEGARVFVVVEGGDERLALLRTSGYIVPTGRIVTDLEERGWTVRYNYAFRDTVEVGDVEVTTSSSPYQGNGSTRKAVWELSMVKMAGSILKASVVSEMIPT